MERTSKVKGAFAAVTLAAALGVAGVLSLPLGDAGKDAQDTKHGVAATATASRTAQTELGAAQVSARRISGSTTPGAVRLVGSRAELIRPKVGYGAPVGRRWWASARFPSWGRSYTFAAVTIPAGQERRVETESQTLPGSCSHSACTQDRMVDGREVSIAGSESRSVDTPSVDVPGRCAGVVCIGSFSIRSLHAASTPGSESRSVSSPDAHIPAACRAARRACMGPTEVRGQTVLVVPAGEERTITEPIDVSVSLDGVAAGLTPHVGEFDSVGPFFFPVSVPEVGVIEITLCPDGCASPRTTEGSMHGTMRVGVSYGDTTRSTAVPVDREW